MTSRCQLRSVGLSVDEDAYECLLDGLEVYVEAQPNGAGRLTGRCHQGDKAESSSACVSSIR